MKDKISKNHFENPRRDIHNKENHKHTLVPIIWIFAALFILSLTCFAVQSEDLFMYLAIARDFFKNGTFPMQDPFLYSIPNYSWTIMHQWLAYLFFYGLYLIGGYSLIVITKSVLITAGLFMPLMHMQEKSKTTLVWGLSIIISMFAMSFRLTERTALFSDLLTIIVLNILLSEQKRPNRTKYFLPLIFGLWVNLHPGFPIGWGLCGLYLLAHINNRKSLEYKKLFGLTLISILICFANPLGFEGLFYPFSFIQNEGVMFRKVYFEWMPTLDQIYLEFSQTYFILGLIIINLILLLILLIKSWKAKPVFEFLTSAFFIFYGLYAIRFVSAFAFALVTLNTSLADRIFLIDRKYPADRMLPTDKILLTDKKSLLAIKSLTFKNFFKFQKNLPLQNILTRFSKSFGISFNPLFKCTSVLTCSSLFGFILASVLIVLTFRNMFWGYESIAGHREFGLGLNVNATPLKAAEFIEQSGLKDNIYNSHMFGSYLAWAWDGQRKIFYHGFVTDTQFFIKEYIGFSVSKAKFEAQVAKYQIGIFLIDRFKGNELLINILSQHPNWSLAYRDEISLVFTKKPL